jgi:hypothetical protein
MPAEAIHLSALQDSLPDGGKLCHGILTDPSLREAARLGAVLVDLPYFDRFSRAVMRYLFHLEPQTSRWGDILHHRAPIALGRELSEAAVKLQKSSATAAEGRVLQALAIGYISHAAVDTSMHPMVNSTARARARRLGGAPSRQHQEVEKFQSIIFHEKRFGFDFMGTKELLRYIAVDAAPLVGDSGLQAVAQAVAESMHKALGEAPSRQDFRRWAKGYKSYAQLIASPLGKTIAPPRDKEREGPALFAALDFPAHFARAVTHSARFIKALCEYMKDGVFDESARAALAKEIPEGTIDPSGEELDGSEA